MFKKLYHDFWQIIDPALYSLGTCSAFGMWLAVF